MEYAINYLAVLVAAIASMIIESLWYGPLFGKVWISLMGFTEEKIKEVKAKGMSKTYAVAFLGSLVTAYVLAHFAIRWGAAGVGGAFELAFWIWLGFIVTTMLGSVLWEGKPVKLYILNTVYYLVSFFVMAIILVSWK